VLPKREGRKGERNNFNRIEMPHIPLYSRVELLWGFPTRCWELFPPFQASCDNSRSIIRVGHLPQCQEISLSHTASYMLLSQLAILFPFSVLHNEFLTLGSRNRRALGWCDAFIKHPS
jgi:hypothetical protein